MSARVSGWVLSASKSKESGAVAGPFPKGSTISVAALLISSLLTVLVACSPSGGEAEGVEETSVQEEAHSPLSVRASLDKVNASVGERIRLVLEIEYSSELSVEPLVLEGELGDLEVVESGRNSVREVRGRSGVVEWAVLRSTEVGSYIVPPIVVTANGPDGEEVSASSSELYVDVVSVLPEEAQDIRGLKPLEQGTPWTVWAAWLAVVALLGALLWWWRTRRANESEEIVLQAHERAFMELEALRATDFSNVEALRDYYFSLSAIVRRYIEERFGLNATDLTTQEIARELEGQASTKLPPPKYDDTLMRLFRAADEVKFARAIPEQSEIEEVYEAALGFIESTAPTEEEEAEEKQAQEESTEEQQAKEGLAEKEQTQLGETETVGVEKADGLLPNELVNSTDGGTIAAGHAGAERDPTDSLPVGEGVEGVEGDDHTRAEVEVGDGADDLGQVDGVDGGTDPNERFKPR